MEREKIKNKYQNLISENEAVTGKLKRRLFVISMLRLLVFVAGVVAAFRTFGNSSIAGIIVLFFFIVFFLLLVKYYLLLSERIHHQRVQVDRDL